MSTLTTIELHKDSMSFCAGHFTIFSANHRERLHGHNYQIYAALTAEVQSVGMAFDYRIYKRKLDDLCNQLDHIFLLPGQSPHLKLSEENGYLIVYFHQDRIPFLPQDVLILPLKNITVEELAQWFVNQLVNDQASIQQYCIREILIKVYSGPGKSGSAHWQSKVSIDDKALMY